MLDAQHIDLRPMIIDSFAGGGGASTGIEIALGRSPDVAINHSEKALALHAANHPETLHLDSNIWDVDPLTVTGGRPVGLLWASPDCKHFSKAKGGAPRDRNIRDLAWVVVKWAEDVKPDVICMENVEEFPTWGPVDNDGQPIKEFAGQTYELWLKRLRKAGYRCRSRELKACDYGAPTIRKRWFFVARRDGRPIVWPKPTHGDQKSAAVKRGRLLPWRTAAECIDWSLPCPSIFDSSAEIMEKHGLRAIRPLAGNTLARVARGIARYVLEAERPFLVNLTDGAAAPSITRFNGGATGSDMREPAPTVTANSYIKRPGGAAPLGIVAPALATFYGHGDGRGTRAASLQDPLRTVTVENRHALVAPCLASIAHGDSGGRREYPLTETFGVVTAGGICHALVSPNLMSLKGTARRDSAADAPHPTVLAGGGHSAIVAPHIMTMRNSQKPFNGIDEPTHTITSGGAGLTLVSPTLIQTGYGEREGQAPRSLDLHQPLGTVVAGGVKHATIAAFLAQQNNDSRRIGGVNPGRSARDPMATICASGSHQTPVAAWFAKYYGTGDGARCDEPLHTVTVKDRMGHLQATLEAPPFTAEHEARAREVAAFLREQGAWAGGEFVTLDIDGATFVIVDIGMRMLTPRELFSAQGFPFWKESYTFNGWRDYTIQPEEGPELAFGKTAHAKSAERFFPWSSPFDQREHVGASARIDLGQRRLVVSSPERSNFAAPDAAKSVSYPLPTEIVGIARQLVLQRTASVRAMATGAAVPQVTAQPSTLLPYGAPPAMTCGGAMAGRADGVDASINIQTVALRFTTLQAGPLSPTCASLLKTLCSYVADAIASSTPGKTCQVSLFDVDLTIDASYVIEGVWEERDDDWHWRAFSKDVQVSCCGNSVCPPLAAAIVSANCRHLTVDAAEVAA